MLNTYGDLLNILYNNTIYTDKDIWVGNGKEGFKCATDGAYVQKKSEAVKHSANSRNKEVLFMGTDTAYVQKMEHEDVTIYGYLKADHASAKKWLKNTEANTGCESIYTVQEPFCILKTGEYIFFPYFKRNTCFLGKNLEEDLHKPSWTYVTNSTMWENVNRATTKLTNGKLANDELKAIFEGLHPTEYDYERLKKTEAGTVQPRSYVNRIQAMCKYEINMNHNNGYDQDDYVVFEGLDALETTDTGTFLDFDKEGAPVFRVYNKGYEVGRVDQNGKMYIAFNKDFWVLISDEYRFMSLTSKVKVVDEKKYKDSPIGYAVIDFNKDLRSILAEITLNKKTPYEQLMKTEYAKAISEYLDIQNEIRTNRATNRLLDLFGIDYFKENAKTLYQKVYLNKYQFKRIMDSLKEKTLLSDCLQYMRYFAKQFKVDFVSLSNDQFDILFDFCNNHFKLCQGSPLSYYSDYTELLTMGYSDFFKMMGMMNTLRSDLNTKYNKQFKIREKSIVKTIYEICWGHFIDYYSMRNSLLKKEFIRKKDAPIDIYTLYNRDEIGFQEMHDKLIKWTNLQKKLELETTTPEWDAQYKEWQKLEYISNKKGLCVIAPVNPAKLVEEGKALRHCVSGYIERVTKGYTSVVFIRKTSEPDTPYFTVEVQNGLIKQIHGNCNCNPNKDVLAFVHQWAKTKGLRLGNYKQLLG